MWSCGVDTCCLARVDEGDVRHVCDGDACAALQSLLAPVDVCAVGACVREVDVVPLALDDQVVAAHYVDANLVFWNPAPDSDLWTMRYDERGGHVTRDVRRVVCSV